MRFHQLWILSLIYSQALAIPFNVVESVPSVPKGWTKLRDAGPSRMMRFQVAVEHNQQEQFERTLLEVSQPGHPRYGQHLSREQLKAMLRPKPESTDTVVNWLKEGGASHIEDDGELISFSCSMQQAESLMDTKFGVYKYHASNKISTRALKYSVPENVRPHIRMIHPTIRFGQPKPQYSNAGRFQAVSHEAQIPQASMKIPATLNTTFCNTTITPECLRALYSIGDYKATPGVGSMLGVTGYLGEIPKFADLNDFLTKNAPYAVGSNFSSVTINGGSMNQTRQVGKSDVEGSLDMQYTTPFVFNTSTTFYSTGGMAPWQADVNFPTMADDGNEPYLDWLNYMSKLPNEQLPQTITTSYGEDEQAIPEAYTKQVCDMLGQLGARGVSVIFSSGDNGPGTGCQANFAPLTGQPRFLANFPGTCPWVTTVGGTVHVAPEQAINISTGGFSERFPRPTYQATVVPPYLSTISKEFSSMYNPGGRAVPDVSAQARNFTIFATGGTTGVQKEGLIGGTSASAPVFASIVHLMNNARLANNMSAMGFLNPFIYGAGREAFTDITVGKSEGCEGVSAISGKNVTRIANAGWNATTGWDAVTGMGTPNFMKLLDLAAPGAVKKHLDAGGNFGISTPPSMGKDVTV